MGGHHQGALEVMAEQVTGRGTTGVVTAAAPLAAALGAEALRAGGNAADAAVVAALAETVLLPPKCGLGGDLVALRLPPGRDEPEVLLAIGGAPTGLADAVRRRGHLPETGPLSVGPPAAPAGYAELAELGRFDRARLAAPAARLAREGVVWSSICDWLGRESADLVAEHQPDGCAYMPGGRPLDAGTVVRLLGLADLLDEWVARGAGLWDGPAGDAVVARVRAAGGVLAPDDLRRFATATWASPVVVEVAGWRVRATPAPTHGPALLDALVTAGGPSDPGRLLDALRAATARRRATLADPGPAGTSLVTAVDGEGTVVAVMHSNSYPQFGSGLVVPEYDLILANRAGRGFTAEPGHPNFPEPGRRPATTLHLWAAGPGGGRPRVVGGTPGGANQLTWNLQLLADLLGGEDRPGHLVARPRWEWSAADDGLVVEEGFTDGDLGRLRAAAGGAVAPVGRWGLRCAQQVALVPAGPEPRVAAADPRTVGAAVPV